MDGRFFTDDGGAGVMVTPPFREEGDGVRRLGDVRTNDVPRRPRREDCLVCRGGGDLERDGNNPSGGCGTVSGSDLMALRAGNREFPSLFPGTLRAEGKARTEPRSNNGLSGFALPVVLQLPRRARFPLNSVVFAVTGCETDGAGSVMLGKLAWVDTVRVAGTFAGSSTLSVTATAAGDFGPEKLHTFASKLHRKPGCKTRKIHLTALGC
jgi:hypothetical protein